MLGQMLSSQSVGSKTSHFEIKVEDFSYNKTSQNDITFYVPITNMEVTDILERGICYKVSDGTMPTTDDYVVSEVGPFSPPGDFSISVTGLATNTTYTFRPYIITIYGIMYGEPVDVEATDVSQKFYLELYS